MVNRPPPRQERSRRLCTGRPAQRPRQSVARPL